MELCKGQGWHNMGHKFRTREAVFASTISLHDNTQGFIRLFVFVFFSDKCHAICIAID